MSNFIHADYRAISQFKLICDEIFGQENLVNELIWAYRTAGNSKEFWARKHDNILFYQKSDKRKFNLIKEKSYHLKKYDYGDHYEEFYDDEKGMWYSFVNPVDVWTDIYPLKSTNNERVYYPTQKPEALLKKIIEACTDEGDLVADFFCGSGTTCASLHPSAPPSHLAIVRSRSPPPRGRLAQRGATADSRRGDCHAAGPAAVSAPDA